LTSWSALRASGVNALPEWVDPGHELREFFN